MIATAVGAIAPNRPRPEGPLRGNGPYLIQSDRAKKSDRKKSPRCESQTRAEIF